MKIGIDARLWSETGVGRYIRNLVRHLAQIDQDNEYVLFVKQKDFKIVRKNIPDKWKIIKFNARWHSLTEQVAFPFVLYKQQLDLVHFPYFSIPILYKKPYVITLHDLIIHHFSTGKASTLPLPLYHLKRAAYKKIISHAAQKAQKIIVPLKCVKQEVYTVLKVPEDKIYVTREGYDENIKLTDKDSIKKEPFQKYFLYVGNAYPHKNLEKLIEGFLKFNQEKKYALVLVGKEDFFYRNLERQYKEEKEICFKHQVDDMQLATLYNQAIALVSASYMEGFGLPCLEAAANSCLVVVSDIPAFREVCGENALYFNPHKSSEITEAFAKSLSLSKSLRAEMLLAGRQRAKGFSWKRMAEETKSIYESCVSL